MSFPLRLKKGLPFRRGVNLSGFESAGNIYALPSTQAVDYAYSKGFRGIRATFDPTLMISAPGGPLNANYLALYKSLTDYVGTKPGMVAKVDPHERSYYIGATIDSNGNRSGGTPVIIGETAQFTPAHWGDAWGRICTALSGSHLEYELMNEPHDQDDTKLAATLNAAITAIRSAGRQNKILIPFNSYSNRFAWLNERARMIALLGNIIDPLNNNAIVVHCYPDGGSAGTTTDVLSDYMDGIVDITQWARANGRKLSATEVGTGFDAKSLAALRTMWNYFLANRDVWIAADYWTMVTGQDENNPPLYRYQLLPIQLGTAGLPGAGPYTDRPQMGILASS